MRNYKRLPDSEQALLSKLTPEQRIVLDRSTLLPSEFLAVPPEPIEPEPVEAQPDWSGASGGKFVVPPESRQKP